jgi:hypothetical protein
MNLDEALRALAATQQGLLARWQVLSMGGSKELIRHRVATGLWVKVGSRVLGLAGCPESEARDAMAAVLDAGPGAVLSHLSAARWWGLPGYLPQPIHISTDRRPDLITAPLGEPHRIRALRDHHSTTLNGVPVVRPELLALQLCGSVHPARAERALDRMWSMRLLSGPSTRRVLDEVAGSGVRGVTVLRALLDERGPAYAPPASGLEARFAQILRDSGREPMERQVDLGDDECWCGRVDFADRCGAPRRALMEVDSEIFHSALVDVEADRRRQVRLERAGFVVGRVTDVQVFHRPREVLAAVDATRRRARQ